MSIDIGAEFMLDLSHDVKDIHRRVHKRRPVPIRRIVGNSATGTAPLQLALPLDVPPGRLYNILSLALFGADGHTVLASAVTDIYLASSGVALPDFSAQIVTGAIVPSVQYLSKEVLWAQPRESLVAIVYGFAATATVEMIARVADYCIEDEEALYA